MGPRERKEREKAERREEILLAGEKLFVRKGFFGTTMDEIARAAELAKGTLYLYFPSKEALLAEIILKALRICRDMMQESLTDVLDPIDRLGALGEGYFRFHEQYPEHFQLLSNHASHEGMNLEGLSDLMKEIDEVHAEIWSLSTGIITDGMAQGVFRPDTDPLEVSLSLWGISNFFIGMKGHIERSRDCGITSEDVLLNVDFMRALDTNARRIIYSIMSNPPADFSFTPPADGSQAW
jgi:TetR/AcrR family transcriptional regulator